MSFLDIYGGPSGIIHPYSMPVGQIYPAIMRPTPCIRLPYNQSQAPKRKNREGLRRGKWMAEEENYTNKLIEAFNCGILQSLESGITLRAFLSSKLNCDPMRISKKFTGALCMGKKVYHKVDPSSFTSEAIFEIHKEIDELEKQFKEKLDQANKERWIELNGPQPVQTAHIISTPAIDAMMGRDGPESNSIEPLSKNNLESRHYKDMNISTSFGPDWYIDSKLDLEVHHHASQKHIPVEFPNIYYKNEYNVPHLPPPRYTAHHHNNYNHNINSNNYHHTNLTHSTLESNYSYSDSCFSYHKSFDKNKDSIDNYSTTASTCTEFSSSKNHLTSSPTSTASSTPPSPTSVKRTLSNPVEDHTPICNDKDAADSLMGFMSECRNSHSHNDLVDFVSEATVRKNNRTSHDPYNNNNNNNNDINNYNKESVEYRNRNIYHPRNVQSVDNIPPPVHHASHYLHTSGSSNGWSLNPSGQHPRTTTPFPYDHPANSHLAPPSSSADTTTTTTRLKRPANSIHSHDYPNNHIHSYINSYPSSHPNKIMRSTPIDEYLPSTTTNNNINNRYFNSSSSSSSSNSYLTLPIVPVSENYNSSNYDNSNGTRIMQDIPNYTSINNDYCDSNSNGHKYS